MFSNYIVVEGLEGAGKTNACNVIVNTLKELGVKEIFVTHEPGGTPFTEKLRSLMLDIKSIDNEKIHYKTEMLIFYAARIQLIETVIKPALAVGQWVVSDRHDLSTQAYQGGGRGINQYILKKLHSIVLGNFKPNLTLYLDIAPEIGLARIYSRRKFNRIEQESLAFFKRTRAKYLELALKNDDICIIDASQSLRLVNKTIREIIIRWFSKKKL